MVDISEKIVEAFGRSQACSDRMINKNVYKGLWGSVSNIGS